MRVLFLPSQCLPFHGRTLEERPIGGTETGVICLAESLSKLGIDVTVVSDFNNPPLTHPLYIPQHALQFVDEVDAMIAVRDWRVSLLPIPAKKRFFLTGDSFDQPQTVGLGDSRVAQRIDRLLAVSAWQADTLCHESGFPKDRAIVIRNGIKHSLFEGEEVKNPKRLIYSSTPYRGLQLLPALYREISKRHPDSELHVFSGYDVYAGGAATDPRLLQQYDKIVEELKSIHNVFIHGNVKQSQLAREFMKSSILAYPNTFAETSCITALEAQAAGCIPVTSNFGALPETVGDGGVLVDGSPDSLTYQKEFINTIDGLLSNPELRDTYSARAKERAKEFGWDDVAKRTIQAIEALL